MEGREDPPSGPPERLALRPLDFRLWPPRLEGIDSYSKGTKSVVIC